MLDKGIFPADEFVVYIAVGFAQFGRAVLRRFELCHAGNQIDFSLFELLKYIRSIFQLQVVG